MYEKRNVLYTCMFLFISVVFLSIIDFHLKKKKIAETDKYKKKKKQGRMGVAEHQAGAGAVTGSAWSIMERLAEPTTDKQVSRVSTSSASNWTSQLCTS